MPTTADAPSPIAPDAGTRRFLCTMEHGRTDPRCRWARIDDQGLVTDADNDQVPIEDFGMWMLLDHEITPDEAFERILGLLARADAHLPSVY